MYVTTPSENFAEREAQVSNYAPNLCFKVGQTHRAYNWACTPRGEWDEAQAKAYREGYHAPASVSS